MWIDGTGAVHTVWVPPASILGEQAVQALRAVPAEQAELVLAELGEKFEQVQASAVAGAAGLTGPEDLLDVDEALIPYPPELPGLDPGTGDSVSDAVLTYVAGLPAQWRIEALEAVMDVLMPDLDENEVDGYFAEHAGDGEPPASPGTAPSS